LRPKLSLDVQSTFSLIAAVMQKNSKFSQVKKTLTLSEVVVWFEVKGASTTKVSWPLAYFT